MDRFEWPHIWNSHATILCSHHIILSSKWPHIARSYKELFVRYAWGYKGELHCEVIASLLCSHITDWNNCIWPNEDNKALFMIVNANLTAEMGKSRMTQKKTIILSELCSTRHMTIEAWDYFVLFDNSYTFGTPKENWNLNWNIDEIPVMTWDNEDGITSHLAHRYVTCFSWLVRDLSDFTRSSHDIILSSQWPHNSMWSMHVVTN